jgi:hypothetical protein
MDNREKVSVPGRQAWVQVVLMPLAVGLVGILGTYFVTRHQTRSALLLTHATMESAERRSRADQQIKLLEIFSALIVSDDPRQRELAVRVLKAVDPELAPKLAAAVHDNPGESSPVRLVAGTVRAELAEEAKRRGRWFTVIASFKRHEEAARFVETLNRGRLPYEPQIFFSENGYYAVTLGSALPYAEALERADHAKRTGLARDAYVSTSPTRYGDAP